jgi:hypothetical protein
MSIARARLRKLHIALLVFIDAIVETRATTHPGGVKQFASIMIQWRESRTLCP